MRTRTFHPLVVIAMALASVGAAPAEPVRETYTIRRPTPTGPIIVNNLPARRSKKRRRNWSLP